MIPWTVDRFEGGMNNKVGGKLAANQCVEVQNFICTVIDRIDKRPGQAKLNSVALGGALQGLYGFYYGATPTRKLMAAANGSVYYWDSTAFSAAIKTGLNATAPIDFVTFNDVLISMNSLQAPWKYDGTTVSALANAPATGKCPIIHKEQLFCISDNKTIKWTSPFLPETWPAINIWQFDGGDGDKLISLWSTRRGMLACMQRKIFTLFGSSYDDFRVETSEYNHGPAGLRAGVVREPFFYYIDEDGIMQFDGLSSNNMTINTIPETWATVNKAYLSTSVAGYNPAYNHLWFNVPVGSSTTPNKTLVYDLNFGSWWLFDGIVASCMALFDNGTAVKLYNGHTTDGYVIEQNYVTYSDYGTAITAYYVGANYDGGDTVKVKTSRKIFAIDANSLNDTTLQYRTDYGSYSSPVAVSDLNNVRKYKFNAKYRKFQPKFTHNTLNQGCSLSGFKLLHNRGRDK
ncbi:MAG: hypothetical protein WC834_00085 [Eubacteriales bacterium]